MGISERKQRHQEELRRRVLAVAEDLFVNAGYDHVSMRKIAERIEYSPTTIYRLFANKAEIMHQLVADGYQRVRERYHQVLRERPASPLAALGGIIRAYVHFAVDNPNHYRLWFATGELDVEEGSLVMRHGQLRFTVYETWFDLIAECQQQLLFAGRSVHQVFQLIWSAVHGLVSLRLQHPLLGWMPLEQQLDELLAMIKRGVAEQPPPAP